MTTLVEIESAVALLPMAERLQLMETLWAGLTRDGQLSSPAWHEDALATTARRLEAGQEEILDWEDAKKRLRDKTA